MCEDVCIGMLARKRAYRKRGFGGGRVEEGRTLGRAGVEG